MQHVHQGRIGVDISILDNSPADINDAIKENETRAKHRKDDDSDCDQTRHIIVCRANNR